MHRTIRFALLTTVSTTVWAALGAGCDRGEEAAKVAGEQEPRRANAEVQAVSEAPHAAFEPPALWARPIDDYISTAEETLGHRRFDTAIHDMVVFADRLYIAYGDARANLGSIIPVELRSWVRPEPEAIRADFVVNEEKIDHFRVSGDLLMVPGFDPTGDEWHGNAYTLRERGRWVESRSLDQAVHVHDMAVVGERIYACGSGGSRSEYDRGDIHGLLFESNDGGATFTLVDRIRNPLRPGDNRLVHLLVVDRTLYVFGYQIDGRRKTVVPTCFRLDGDTLRAAPLLPSVLVVTRTEQVLPTSGYVIGAQGATNPRFRSWWVTGAGVQEVASLRGKTWVDACPIDQGRLLVLSLEGDGFPTRDGPQSVQVSLLTNGTDVTELIRFKSDQRPRSVAYWRQALYVGMSDGTVWRSDATIP